MQMKYVLSLAMVGVFGFSLVSYASYAEPTGDVKGRAKVYGVNGYLKAQVNDAKARLYKESGKRVDSDKTRTKGRFNFDDVKVGKYYIKCSADGFVNAKKPEKEKYTTSTFKVKEGKTVTKNCRMSPSDETLETIATDGTPISYSERPKGTSKREWRAIQGF